MSVIWWPAMCGNQSGLGPFWSESETWNNTNPDLTPCFQRTVLSVTPCVYLWLTCLFYVPYLWGKATVNPLTRTSRFNTVKTVFCALLALIQLIVLIRNITEHVRGKSHPLVDFLQPAILFLTFILACWLTLYEFRKGIHSEGVLFFLWMLVVVLGIVPFRSHILHIQYDQQNRPVVENEWSFVTFYLSYALQLALFISTLFSDLKALPWLQDQGQSISPEKQPLLGESSRKQQRYSKQEVSPELLCPFWQKILFLWLSGLIIRGYKRTLDMKDMWPLLNNDTSRHILPKVLKYWDNEVSKTHYRMVTKHQEPDRPSARSPKSHSKSDFDVSGRWTAPDLVHIKQGNKERPPKLPSFWNVVVNTFGPYYILGGFYNFLYTIITFLNPVLLNLLISFVGSGDPFVWRGYLYVILLVIVSQVKSIFNQWYWHSCFVTGLRMRTAVIGIIYRKALKINNASRTKSTTGEIVNLMSVDAQKLQDIPGYLHLLWSAPLTIAIALYFLWQQLGPSVMAGFGLLLLLVPLNALVAQKTRTLQIQQMRLKDQRLKLMNEVLNGIKVLKLYAWEKSFEERILAIRGEEVRVLKKSQYLNAGSALSWFMAPYLVALGSFATYTLSSPSHVLDANKAFVSLSLFNIMNFPISMLPGCIAFGVQAGVSIGRINRFLRNQELDPDNVTEESPSGSVISVRNGTFAWNKDEKPILHRLNLSIGAGKLVAVVGHVGAGKSSLLSALLGEMEVLAGSVSRTGSLAYVPQQAWIQNTTLRNNVLFEKPFNDHNYQKVIEACALVPDLQILPGGDQIEIGEKGINLSGGQKQRVSLARAVYQNTDIYLLDDPLSAVDAHVGKHIFEQVIGETGMLRNKTRVLVTNGITYLPKTDLIICLKDGRVSEMGTYSDLLSKDGAFAEFMATYLKELSSDEDDKELSEMKTELKKQISVLSRDGSTKEPESGVRGDQSSHRSGSSVSKRIKKKQLSVLSDKERIEREEKRRKDQKLTEEEQTMVGGIKLSVISAWIRSCKPVVFSAMMLFYLVYLSAQAAGNIWLSEWSSDPPAENGTQDIGLRNLRLAVYGALGGIQAFGTLGHSFMMAVACVSSSRLLHWQLLVNILKAPMSFFDTTPLGRIINRFSKDVDTLDVNIPVTLRIWMGTMSVVITTVFVICYSTPIFIVVVIPLGIFYFFIQRFYVATSRQLRRIDSVKRSPTYVHFSETLSGLSSVRAYQKVDSFINKSDTLVDENQMAYYPNIVSNRWLGILLDIIGNLIVLFAGVFAVVQREGIGPGLAGLSINYALQITGTLNVWVRMSSDLENYIVAVERIQEYADCPKEAAAVVEDTRPSSDWPAQGRLVFENYSTRYRPGLDLVLRNVSCEIKPGERIGVVGRTGAGKSSLTLALFRIIEAALGQVIIDNVNIANIGLHDLRSKITIIPQDPVLFSGSLRMNLDPFEHYSDGAVWLALQQAHLKTFVKSLPTGLSHLCSEGGENLSVGQRQLVCLARALLRRTQILVLDEATAAVDLETDDLIQTSIRTEFKHCTVITIAHRLNTVLDYDRIMVLDHGEIVELDTPSTLLENKASIFYSMAANAGLV